MGSSVGHRGEIWEKGPVIKSYQRQCGMKQPIKDRQAQFSLCIQLSYHDLHYFRCYIGIGIQYFGKKHFKLRQVE